MKYTVFLLFAGVAFFFYPLTTHAQQKLYEVSTDKENGAKVLKGIVTRADIEKDTSFSWFKQNYALGSANAAAIESCTKQAGKFTAVVFFGTWCEDSHNLLPVFYRLMDKAGIPEKDCMLVGTDREKTTLQNLHITYAVTNVPTFIILHNGKEIGRIVEYGKYGVIDKEIGEIVAAIP